MNDMFKNVVLRADGNAEVGYGHLSRLNALANIVKSEFNVVFLTRYNSNISLIEKNIEIIKIPKDVCLRDEVAWIYKKFNSKNNFIVVDGYQFNSNYQKKIKELGYKLMLIDDLMKFHMHADFVVNHAMGLQKSQYKGENYVKYFFGSKYALLRNSFMEFSKSKKEKEIKLEIAFVSFGGTNTAKITRNSVNSLLNFENFKKINVVIGKSFSDVNLIKLFEQNERIKIFKDIGENKIFKIMINSDIAIVPSSTISYELAATRCIIASGFTSKNQLHIYNGLLDKNIIFGLGNITNFEEEDFNKHLNKILNYKKEDFQIKIKNQIKYFDGKQKDRFLKIFKT